MNHQKTTIETIGNAMHDDFFNGIEIGLDVSRRVFNTGDGQGIAAWMLSVGSGTILGGVVGWGHGLYRGVADAILPKQFGISPLKKPQRDKERPGTNYRADGSEGGNLDREP